MNTAQIEKINEMLKAVNGLVDTLDPHNEAQMDALRTLRAKARIVSRALSPLTLVKP